MKISTLLLFLLILGEVYLQAHFEPAYRMDSWAFQSDIVIYCEEETLEFKSIDHGNWVDRPTVTTCRVLQTFKGNLQPGSQVVITYDDGFRRETFETFFDHQIPNSYINGATGELVQTPPKNHAQPLGRSLIFLKIKQPGDYEVLTAKLVIPNHVLGYQQFSNPGPLFLTEQGPENITLLPNEKYGEKELLQDMTIALAKSASLKEPVPIYSR